MVDPSGLFAELSNFDLGNTGLYNFNNALDYSFNSFTNNSIAINNNPVGYNTVLAPEVNDLIDLTNYLDNYSGDYQVAV